MFLIICVVDSNELFLHCQSDLRNNFNMSFSIWFYSHTNQMPFCSRHGIVFAYYSLFVESLNQYILSQELCVNLDKNKILYWIICRFIQDKYIWLWLRFISEYTVFLALSYDIVVERYLNSSYYLLSTSVRGYYNLVYRKSNGWLEW